MAIANRQKVLNDKRFFAVFRFNVVFRCKIDVSVCPSGDRRKIEKKKIDQIDLTKERLVSVSSTFS